MCRTAFASLLAIALYLVACSSSMAPVCDDDRTLFTGNVWGGNVAVAGGRVYYTTFDDGPTGDQHSVWSVAQCGGAPSLVWSGGPDELFGFGMAVSGNQVFWSQMADDGGNAVFTAPTYGGPRTMLAHFHTLEAAYAGIAADDTTVYAASYDEILAVPIAGGPATTLYSGYVHWGTVLSGGSLYFTADEALWRIDSPSSPGATPVRVSAIPGVADGEFSIIGANAYVAATDDVMIVPLDGSPIAEITDMLSTPTEVVVSTNYAYVQVGTPSGYGIARIPLLGGPAVLVYDGIRSGTGHLALTTDALYVVDCCNDPGSTSGGKVVRIAL